MAALRSRQLLVSLRKIISDTQTVQSTRHLNTFRSESKDKLFQWLTFVVVPKYLRFGHLRKLGGVAATVGVGCGVYGSIALCMTATEMSKNNLFGITENSIDAQGLYSLTPFHPSHAVFCQRTLTSCVYISITSKTRCLQNYVSLL